MNDYNFISDLLDTFQSSSDFIKALMIVTPPAFVLGLVYVFKKSKYEEPAPTQLPENIQDRVDLIENSNKHD